MSKVNSLEAFLFQNKVEKEPEKIFVTDSFIDDKGKPILWEIRPIGSDEEKKISDSVTKNEKDKRTGTITQIRDDAEYLARLSAAAVVWPDLSSRELQESYGPKVNTKTALLRQMLTVGELVGLAENVMRVSGLAVDDDQNNELELEADIEFSKN